MKLWDIIKDCVDGQNLLGAGIDAEAAALAKIGVECNFCHFLSSLGFFTLFVGF